MKASESKIITQFQYLEWPENETPKSAVQLFDMIDQLLKWQQGTENKSITVHCKYDFTVQRCFNRTTDILSRQQWSRSNWNILWHLLSY